MIFRRILLPLAVATTRIPFVFPPMVFLSIRLPLLLPTKPTPKELLTVLSVGLTEPLPLYTFNRTRLLWLLTSQVPPQAVPSKPKFRTETLCAMSLSVAPETRIPLKQLSAAVTCSTRTWLLPDSNIPIRAKFRTKPGPKITTLLWLAVVIPSSGSKGAGKWVQLVGGFACPVMVKAFSLNVISGAPNLIQGALLTVQETSPVSSLSRYIQGTPPSFGYSF